MTNLEILTQAQDLIRDPKHWTQHVYAREADGEEATEPHFEAAVCWCSLGAILKVIEKDTDFEHHPTFTLLEAAIGDHGPCAIPTFNDNHTHEEVMELFDKAKELARASAA